MFPLRSVALFPSGRYDQTTDGWTRAIAPPHDTAPVFFRRSACRPSPSFRPEHDRENLQVFDTTMRARNAWSETVISPNRFRSRPPAACTSEADGRLCRDARLQICVSDPVQMQRPPVARAIPPLPLHDVKQPAARSDRAADLVPAAHFLRPGCRVVVLCPPHLRCLGRHFGGARAQILGSAAAPTPK